MSMPFYRQRPYWYHYVLFFMIALVIRISTFYWYVQHEERYCQPDSVDYHVSAWCLSQGHGMHLPQGKPLFWRTPGYPWYLSMFYDPAGKIAAFQNHQDAHLRSIYVQICLSSLLPLLVFFLAVILTQNYTVAWVSAIISLFHLGFVLASSYLLTDALAMLIFVLFLIYFYQILFDTSVKNGRLWLAKVMITACSLGLFTWMRPMGQFIAIVTAVMLIGKACWLYKRQNNWWKQVLRQSLLFLVIFVASLFPWLLRNYMLTRQWFFCPLFGLYFNAFNAPKILARVENIPLQEAHKKLSDAAVRAVIAERNHYKKEHKTERVCDELVCMKVAWPLIKAHPWYFLYDWITEVIKTTFDLYSSQLVALVQRCFKWDPLVEYLPEKICLCLVKGNIPVVVRIIAWLEFMFALLLWMGIFGGLLFFLLIPLCKPQKSFQFPLRYRYIWIAAGIMVGIVVMQTGGFGYARLRLPIEPLMIILGVTFWLWLYQKKALQPV